jgi:hypothetical protein
MIQNGKGCNFGFGAEEVRLNLYEESKGPDGAT